MKSVSFLNSLLFSSSEHTRIFTTGNALHQRWENIAHQGLWIHRQRARCILLCWQDWISKVLLVTGYIAQWSQFWLKNYTKDIARIISSLLKGCNILVVYTEWLSKTYKFPLKRKLSLIFFSGSGLRLAYPTGDSDAILGRFDKEDVEIKLPVGHEASKLRWFSVWCRRFSANFGDVMFETRPATSEKVTVEVLPENKVGDLRSLAYGVQVRMIFPVTEWG